MISSTDVLTIDNVQHHDSPTIDGDVGYTTEENPAQPMLPQAENQIEQIRRSETL